MAYATLLESEVEKANILAVISPRKKVASFSVYSGAVYRASFSLGHVSKVFEDQDELTQAFSVSLSAGEYYWDYTNNYLYVRLTSGGNPNSINTIAEYELYLGAFDAHWYRDPLDTSSREVYFEPLITETPTIKQSISESIYGFNPIQSLQITLNNSEHDFEKHLGESSFNDASIKVYHLIGELSVDNIALLVNGFVRNVSLRQPRLVISFFDRIDELTKEWRNPTGQDSFFTVATFANLDPQYENKPIRTVYGGPVDGFKPVNIDYNGDLTTITTNDNRDYVICSGQTNLSDLSFTVKASPSSTTTRTYLSSAPNGVNVGDSIWLDKATDEYALVTAIGADYLDHSTIVTPATTGELVKRGFVSKVTIIQDNVEYTALYNRDYTIQSFSGVTSGFSFSTSLESNLSMTATLTPFDKIYCRVYGPSNFVTLGGPAFGSSDSRTSGFNHPAQIILDILKRFVGVSESDIDSSSFTSALSDAPYGISLSVPEDSNGGFEDYKTVLSKLMKSSLARVFINSSGKYALSIYKPLTSSTKTIEDDEILFQSIQFKYDYDNILSDIIIEYNKRELSNDPVIDEQVSTVSSSSDTAKFLHRAAKSKTERMLWTYEVDAQTFADRFIYIFGDRLGSITLQTKNRFFQNTVGDIITVNRKSLAGNNFDGETLYSQDFRINSIEKSLDGVTIELDDQKGAEDNSGSW